MPGYLLLWNTSPEAWNDPEAALRKYRKTGYYDGDWSTGSRTNIPEGSRVFLKRTRTPVRGIIASGLTTGPVFQSEHWDGSGRQASYVPIRFDGLVDVDSDDLLPQSTLTEGRLSGIHWNIQGGGLEIPDEAVKELESLWFAHLGRQVSTLEKLPPEQQQRELRNVLRVIRNSAFARQVRSNSDGACAVCVPKVRYGAKGILEAAHIRAVYAQGPDDLSNALSLCPNHHRLFDGGLWTIGPKNEVRLSKNLPRDLRSTFASTVRTPWKIDQRHATWHRTNAFERRDP